MSFTAILISIVLPLLAALYFYLKRKYSYFEELDIPHLKPSILFGNMEGVGRTIHMVDMMMKIYRELKEKDVLAGFYMFTSPSYVATDLELVKHITIKDFNIFTDRGVFVNEEEEPLTGNLFGIGGEKWRFLRNKLSPVFTSGKIKLMYNTISDKGDNFVKAIERASLKGSVEMKELSNRFTIDVVSSCAFGMEANTLNDEHPEIVKIFKEVFGEQGTSLIKIIFMFAFPNFSKFIKLRQFNKDVTKFFYDVIGGSIKHREETKEIRNDFLNMLVQLKNKGSIDGEISTETRKLSFDECVAQAFIFFFAGADTSSTVISYAIVELGLQPKIQEKLRKEILQKTADSNGEITYDNLHEMTYLTQVVNETLRKFPPAFMTVREAASDYKIPDSKHVIKKGVQVIIPNIGFHYDDRYWKNPEEFDPDRFTAEETAKRPSMAFMPFGEGPRNCIGMRFAQVNVKFAVATVVKNFLVNVDKSKTHVPLKFIPKGTNISPVGGFYVKFERVSN